MISTPWSGIGGRSGTSDMTRAHLACPSTATQYEYYSPLSPDDVCKMSGPLRVLSLTHTIPGNWVFAWFLFQHVAPAEALVPCSGFRSFRIVLPLQRWL
eukprot:4985670-Pyramimonas_sp.AAC.1